MEKFDLIVIGAGPGGYVAAIKAAKFGMNVAVIENIRAGGTCLNRGCIPAKAMIHASETYRMMVDGCQELGVSCENPTFDYAKIVEYKQGTTNDLVKGIEGLLDANGVTRIEGKGTLEADKTVTVTEADGNKTSYAADKIIIATGSVPALIPIEGIDLPGVLTSDGVFALEEMPESLVIIGGGVIGVEFATVYANLGAQVTIIEALPKVLDMLDKEISQNLKMILKKEGVDIHANAMVQKVEATDGGYTVTYDEKGKVQQATGQYVVCAAGRKPNLDGVFGVGVDIQMAGRLIDTNENFETSIPGVYAIGDCTHGIKLAHTASAQGIYCVEKMAGHEPSINLDVIPSCVYTDPEIAQVGITEEDAKAAGIDVKVGKFIMSANGKSLITKEKRGFIKVVLDAETDVILGSQMMCARATDMISEMGTAIVNKMTAQDIISAVRPHPTYNEGITEAFEDAIGESLHTAPKRRRK